MITLTTEDLVKTQCYCLKDNNKSLLDKILEIIDYCRFHQLDGITLDIDWRKDRKEEENNKKIIRELTVGEFNEIVGNTCKKLKGECHVGHCPFWGTFCFDDAPGPGSWRKENLDMVIDVEETDD